MPDALPLVDVYKSCHEIFHFAVHKGYPGTEVLLGEVENQFGLLVDRVYPERPSAAHIEGLRTLGFRGGADLSLNEGSADLTKIAGDFSSYRSALKAGRHRIVQEIACDWFALRASLVWQLKVQQSGERPAQTTEEILTAIVLISHLARLVQFWTERAKDIVAGGYLFADQELSRELHLRNIVSTDRALQSPGQLAEHFPHIPQVGARTDGEGPLYPNLERRLIGTKVFLDLYVQQPMGMAINRCVRAMRAMRAKLGNEDISSLYRFWSDSATFEAKAEYTPPRMHPSAYEAYFLQQWH
jgi:hypothetical protein